MRCDWCDEWGPAWRIHLWVLCARHYILHVATHDCDPTQAHRV